MKTNKSQTSNGNSQKQVKVDPISLAALVHQKGHNNHLSSTEGVWEKAKKFGRKINHNQTFDFSRRNIATGIGINPKNGGLVSITASSIGKAGDKTTHSEQRIIAAAREKDIDIRHIVTERQACNSCQKAMNNEGISSSFIVPYDVSLPPPEKRDISDAVNHSRYEKIETRFPPLVDNITINDNGYRTSTDHSSEEDHSPAEEYFGKNKDFLKNRRRARQEREKKSGIESRVPKKITPKSKKPKANNSNFEKPKAINSNPEKPGKSLRARLFKRRQ